MNIESLVTSSLQINLLGKKLKEQQLFQDQFVSFIKNQDIPLAERWEFFEFACKNNLFVKISCWLYHSKLLERNSSFTWYDYFYTEKYQTV
jgi:hypothetical protein